MQDKLQALTDKIYQEGVEKAKNEAEKILQEARKKAQAIEAEAQTQAAQIIKKAEEDSRGLHQKTESELKLAGQKTLGLLKQEISDLITKKVIQGPVREAISTPKFLQKIINTAIKNWNPRGSEAVDLKVLLSEEDQKAVADFFEDNAIKIMENSLEINSHPKIRGGFIIGPQDGSFVVNFTDEALEALFKQYLKPHITNLLFSKTNVNVKQEA